MTAYLDTKIVASLLSGNTQRLTQRALEFPAMVMLELEMLHEKGAIKYSAAQILSDLNQQIGLSLCQLPMASIMRSALHLKWTREPGDRIIVANAIASNEAPQLTSDRRIHEYYPTAIW